MIGNCQGELREPSEGASRKPSVPDAILMEKLEGILEDEEFLLSSLLELIELGSEEDIFRFIAKKLNETTEGSLVIVNSYDEERQESTVRVISGLGKLSAMAMDLLGQNPVDMKFPITGKDKEQMLEQRLVTGPKGFHELSAGKISGTLGSALDKLVGVKGIYGMGFSCHGKLYGNAVIITRKEKAIKKGKLIERFLIQAGIVYQRWLAEERADEIHSLLKAIRNVDQEIANASGVDELLPKVCEILLEARGYMDICIVMADANTGLLRPVAHSGIVDWELDERDLSCGPKCITDLEGQTEVKVILDTNLHCQNCGFCRHEENHQNMIIPILGEAGQGTGLISVCVSKEHHILDEEKKLLREIAGGLSFAFRKYKAEKELRDSEARFRTIYENNIIGFYRTTPDGKILLANNALVRMLDFLSVEELKERNLETEGYEPTYTRTMFKETIEKSGEVTGMESAWVKRDGSTIYVRESANLVRDENGNVLYYDGVVEDITEKKMMEEEIRVAYERVEFYNDLMSHDIANLNQGVVSNLELLLFEKQSEKGRKCAEAAMRNAAESLTLISNLRKYRTLEEGKVETRPVDLATVLRDAVDSVIVRFPDKNIRIESNLNGRKLMASGNEFLFDAIYNILSNAAKFDRHEEVEISIEISDMADNFWRLGIRDRGPGIADDLKSAIFDREHRGDYTVQGTGLGLGLAKNIITSIGGAIWVEDGTVDGKKRGSVFMIAVPKG